jgi:phosphatidylinositol alpha-1,6-mannosyltransferase
VVLLSELYPPDIGGSAVLFQETYERLSGIDVLVATEARTHEAHVRPCGARIVPIPVATRRWGVLHPTALAAHLSLAARLRRLAATPDTVVHCARALPEGVAAWFARRVGGPRYVVWTHGEDIGTALLSRELTAVMRRVYRGADLVLANSRNTQAMLEDLGVPGERVRVVYPGVDAQRFRPDVDGTGVRRRFAPDADLLLLSVGRLQRRKGHDHAIRAMAALRARVPGARYLIVGDGEERPRLESLARDVGVADRVVFAGAVDGSLLPACYAACDVFLMPNRIDHGDVEGFGIVFLEAAATERPAIGGASGGVGEAVADGVTGLLVSGENVGELAGAIERLAADRALCRRLGRAGRQRVLRSFTWDVAAAKVEAVHAAVLGRDA